jgi:hypothetical protein
LEYIAGFFDGEGSLSILQQHGRGTEGRRNVYVLKVQISQQDAMILRLIQAEWGGSIHVDKRTGVSNLQMGSQKAEDFLRAIHPYVKVKAAQIALGLEYREDQKRRNRRWFTEDDLDKINEQRKQMIALNGNRALGRAHLH